MAAATRPTNLDSLIKDPQWRKNRATAAANAKWENQRLRKQLEAMNGSAALILGKLNQKDAKFMAKWPQILELVQTFALDKHQPWAIKMFKEIKDDFVRRATQDLENTRVSKPPMMSVMIENALIQMPVSVRASANNAPESTLAASTSDLSVSKDVIDVPHTPSDK